MAEHIQSHKIPKKDQKKLLTSWKANFHRHQVNINLFRNKAFFKFYIRLKTQNKISQIFLACFLEIGKIACRDSSTLSIDKSGWMLPFSEWFKIQSDPNLALVKLVQNLKSKNSKPAQKFKANEHSELNSAKIKS